MLSSVSYIALKEYRRLKFECGGLLAPISHFLSSRSSILQRKVLTFESIPLAFPSHPLSVNPQRSIKTTTFNQPSIHVLVNHTITSNTFHSLLSPLLPRTNTSHPHSFDKAADDRRQMRYERLLDQQNRLLRSVTHRLRVLETRVMNRKTVNDDEDDDSGDDADDRFDFDHDTKVDLNGHVRQHQQQQQQQQQRKNTPISKRMYNSPTTNNDEDEDENSSSLKDSGFHSREDTISTRSLG